MEILQSPWFFWQVMGISVGVLMSAAGIWFWRSAWREKGFSWFLAFPAFFVFAGLGMIFSTILSVVAPIWLFKITLSEFIFTVLGLMVLILLLCGWPLRTAQRRTRIENEYEKQEGGR